MENPITLQKIFAMAGHSVGSKCLKKYKLSLF